MARSKPDKVLIAVAREHTVRDDVIDVVHWSQSVEESLRNKGYDCEIFYVSREDLKDAPGLFKRLRDINPQCVFNLFEGFSDDSGKEIDFARFLEKTDIPFTGESFRTLGFCLNKSQLKVLLKRNGIHVPRGVLIKTTMDAANVRIDPPLFVKPAFEDASLGIDEDSLVTRLIDLPNAVTHKLRVFPSGLLVEEFISGKEYSVGFLGKELLGISVIDYSFFKSMSPFLTYASKWDRKSREFKLLMPVVEKGIDEILRERIINLSQKVGKVLKCRSYFRLDWREKEGKLFLLDVNPNPDIGRESGFMRQAAHKGFDNDDVVARIVQIALKGHKASGRE